MLMFRFQCLTLAEHNLAKVSHDQALLNPENPHNLERMFVSLYPMGLVIFI